MTSLVTGFFDEYGPFLFSFGLPLCKQRLLVAQFLETRCVSETIYIFLQKYTLYLGMIKAADATFSLQNLPVTSVLGNSGA